MNSLLTSPLVERLGWMILHSLWQITAIAVALAVSRVIFRSPQARHLLAMLAMIACIAWPVATVCLRAKAMPQTLAMVAGDSGEALGDSAGGRTGDAEALSASNGTYRSRGSYTPYMSYFVGTDDSRRSHLLALSSAQRALPMIAAAWLLGVIVLTLRHLGALWSLHRLRTRETYRAPFAIRALARDIGARLGLRRGYRVFISARAVAPMVIGTLRPIILLPTSVLTGFTPDQIEALLAHELAHLRRWDDVLNLLQCAIETLLFFHPVVWWISRRAREDRELCADDLATQRGVDRRTLAEALGQLALKRAHQLALAATGNMPVLARIRRLLLPAPAPMRLNAWPLITLLVLASSFIVLPRAKAEAPPRGRILDRHGIVLAESPSVGERRYPKQTLAAHVLGYTALKRPSDRELFGRSGIELSQDATLAARQDVQLTLDAEIQALAEAALQQHAHSGGAAVVLDPNTGDILALASCPTFNPNEFVPRVTEERFKELAQDKKHPLMPRAVQSTYFPGSTFKLVTALAGLKSGAIDEKTIFDGTPDFKIGDRTFHNWHKYPEGPIDLVTAIKRSTNTWFYQAALKTGSSAITDMASDLGFGQPTGLPTPENKGFLPTDAYYQQRFGHKILPGILASLSIGQVATATPLQVALATAAIGNGGKVLSPRLLKTREPAQVRTDLIAKGLKPEHLNLVKKGMIAVVQGDGGTGHNAMIEGITVAGKTGTAQWVVNEDRDKSRSLAWFTGFAPAETPRLVVTVVYEGTFGEAVSGGAVAAPIAQEIMEGALKKMKPVSWIDALDQQWIASASRLEVPKARGQVVLYHPSDQNLAPGPIRAGDIAVLDSKYLGGVHFYRGDSTIIRKDNGQVEINADEAVSMVRDELPEHWRLALEGKPQASSPPPDWIDADWLQSAKSTTVPFKVTPKNPLMDPPGPAFVFYDGTMTRHEKADAEVATSFTGDVVVMNGQMMVSGQEATVVVSSTGRISVHGPVTFRFVKSGDLPALDAALTELRPTPAKEVVPDKGSASADEVLPSWLTVDWLLNSRSEKVHLTNIRHSGQLESRDDFYILRGPAIFHRNKQTTWDAIDPDVEVKLSAAGEVVANGRARVRTVEFLKVLAMTQGAAQKIMSGIPQNQVKATPATFAKLEQLNSQLSDLTQITQGPPRRRYPNPWPLDSSRPADIIVSSDGRSYDYVPGRGSSVPVAQQHRSTVRLEFEPSLWEPKIKPAAYSDNPVKSDGLRAFDARSERGLIILDGVVPPSQPSLPPAPHLVPEHEKFQPMQLPKAPDSIDDLLSEPTVPTFE